MDRKVGASKKRRACDKEGDIDNNSEESSDEDEDSEESEDERREVISISSSTSSSSYPGLVSPAIVSCVYILEPTYSYPTLHNHHVVSMSMCCYFGIQELDDAGEDDPRALARHSHSRSSMTAGDLQSSGQFDQPFEKI
jgi:hypothetical protein